WVKETLPPRERFRWLLMTTRLSTRSFAGTARTLVAVGTVSDVSMFVTTRADAPRSGDCSDSATSTVSGALEGSRGRSWAERGIAPSVGLAVGSPPRRAAEARALFSLGLSVVVLGSAFEADCCGRFDCGAACGAWALWAGAGVDFAGAGEGVAAFAGAAGA